MGTAIRGSMQSNNHWSIFLIIGAKKSVRFNMLLAPNAKDTTGTLAIKQENYDKSNSAIRVWDVQAKTKFKVSDVYNEIVRKGYHKYRMTAEGTGCRWWV
jgi:hypothetical protein